MGALLQRIQDRITQKTDFANEDLESALEQHTTNVVALATAVSEYEAKAVELEIDPVTAADSLLGLAEQFGDAFPAPSPERRQKIKELVNTLIDEEDAEFEETAERVFAYALDFETSINEINRVVNNLPGDGQ